MKEETIKTILKNIPSEHLTEDFIKDLGIDSSLRGHYYFTRCFIDDQQGVAERAMSDHFKYMYENNNLPAPLRELPDKEQEKLLATMFQWLSTHCGFAELERAYSKGGRILTWRYKDE